jgi:hypothetical protein
MTIDQIFEGLNGKKTIWSKRGDEVTKREETAVSNIRPRNKIEIVKEPSKS